MKFTYAAVLLVLGASNAFIGVEASSNHVRKLLRDNNGSPVNSITTGSNLPSPQHSPARRHRPTASAAAPAAAAAVQSNHPHFIMSRDLFLTKDQINLRTKYDKNKKDYEVINSVFNVFDTVKDILVKFENDKDVTPEEVEACFSELLNGLSHSPNKHLLNLGQEITGKSHGFELCFAIAASILNDNEAEYDQMDFKNCCISYLIRHTWRSHLLDGGTDRETKGDLFTTDVAEKGFKKFYDLTDSIVECCDSTDTDPLGNQWQSMERQLRKESNTYHLKGKDRMTFWWLVANLNSSLRALYYYAKEKKQYTLMTSSVRNRRQKYDNHDAGVVLESPIMKVLNNPHPEAIMGHLSKRSCHSVESIYAYRHNFVEMVKPLKGKIVDGIELLPPLKDEDTEYFLRYGRVDGHAPTENEMREQYIQCLQLYAVPHLAAVASDETKDNDLSGLSVDNIKDVKFNKVDKDNFDELERRLGLGSLVDALKRARKRWCDSALAELNDLQQLAAVVYSYYEKEELDIEFSDYVKSSFDFNQLCTDENNELVTKYTIILGGKDEPKGQNELKKKLIETRQQFDDSAFRDQHVELRRLARVAAANQPDLTANDIESPLSLDTDLFSNETDKISFNKLLDKYGSETLFEMWSLYLKRYQGECPGIDATGKLPSQPCGKSLTVDNPRNTIGSRGTNSIKGSGFFGFQVCKECMKDISEQKYIYHERSILQQKLSNRDISKEQRVQLQERLQQILPRYKAICELDRQHCTVNEVVVKTNQLSNISLCDCKLTRATMLLQDCGGLLAEQRILAVNGIPSDKMRAAAVKELLSKQRENAETVFHVGKLLTNYQESNPVEVEVTEGQKLGVLLMKESLLPQVQDLREGLLLNKCNIGDYILSINGDDVSYMKKDEVLAILKTEGQKRIVFLTQR